jgi:hypothetical protein
VPATAVTTTTLPPVLQASATVNAAEIDEAEVKVIAKIADEKLAADVVEILDGEVTLEEVENLVADEEALVSLDDDSKQIIAAALTEAPDEVKEEFEEEINIFSEGFDDYVPTGSAITVEERRTVVAATAAVSAAAAAASAASSGAGGGGGSGGSSGGRSRSRAKR